MGRKEIDFIIATRESDPGDFKHFLSTPLFIPQKNGTLRRLRTLSGDDQEVEVVLGEHTIFATNSTGKLKKDVDADDRARIFDQNWAITWKNYDPAIEYYTYGLQWLPDSIKWYGGTADHATLRISINKKTTEPDIFPKGPFP